MTEQEKKETLELIKPLIEVRDYEVGDTGPSQVIEAADNLKDERL